MMSSDKEGIWDEGGCQALSRTCFLPENLQSTIPAARGCMSVANAAEMHLPRRDLSPERVAFGGQEMF